VLQDKFVGYKKTRRYHFIIYYKIKESTKSNNMNASSTSPISFIVRSLTIITVFLIITTSARPASPSHHHRRSEHDHSSRHIQHQDYHHAPNHVRRSIRKRQAENVVHSELARKLAELQRLAKLARLMPGNEPLSKANIMKIKVPYYRRMMLRILRRLHRRSS